ncbi:MAG: citrulline utilization hydrolase CtlX [Steroidobacteraceae bacterium]
MVHVPEPQCADAVLMVRPAAFDYNPQTAGSNALQRSQGPGAGDCRELARAEFDRVVKTLRGEGIRVCVAEDSRAPVKPDAIFPNNWVSFHAGGTLVLYPLAAANRRPERRREIVEQAASELGFRVRRTVDLSHHETAGRYLEGTGSLVLDRAHRVAYACRSPRTDGQVLTEWSREMQYEAVPFSAADARGVPLYHTNVMMCIGTRFALVAAELIAPDDRPRVLERLAAGGREIVEIGGAEVEAFAGNMLELGCWDEALGDSSVLVMSAAARQALGARERARLAACVDTVLPVPVPTIERLGGGSVRCMLAEVFSGP